MIFQKWDDIPKMRIIHENIPPESVIELQMIVYQARTRRWRSGRTRPFPKAPRSPPTNTPTSRCPSSSAGGFLFRVEGEEEREVGAGEVVVCKSNVEHWLKALEDGSQDLQIFSPRRDDLLEFRGCVYSGVRPPASDFSVDSVNDS